MQKIINNQIHLLMKILKSIIATLTAIAVFIPVAAQNNVNTPYSRFGYGVLGDRASSSQRAMGGVGYAMSNGRQINVMNPASYAAIDSLTFLFDIGITGKLLNSKQGEEKGNNFNAGLDYITMQVPIGKYMGASVGLLPYSQVGYSFGQEVVNGESAYQGSGTINQAYLGVAGRPFKGFSIGANISYLFGTLLNDNYTTSTNGSESLFEQSITVRDYELNFGLQYGFNIGRKHRVMIGAVYSPGKDFRGDAMAIMYDVNQNSTKPDTIGFTKLGKTASRPATYGGGLSYTWNNSITAEADFTYQPWKSCKIPTFEGFDRSTFADRWKAALGLQYIPDSRGSYMRRVSYRLGAYYNRDYVMVGDNNVKDLGFTLGLGLPAPINRWTKTVVNVGFEYRRRTSSPVKLVTENYFQFTVGVNFNELWFWQNKIQ